MPGLGVSPERTKERVDELVSKKPIKSLYLDPSIKEIPDEHVYASIALAGGEAYPEDIRWILENLFGYSIKFPFDLESLLDDLPGLEWELDKKREEVYWRMNKKFLEKYKDAIEKAMRDAMGYVKEPTGLETLFDTKETGKELNLWENYKG